MTDWEWKLRLRASDRSFYRGMVILYSLFFLLTLLLVTLLIFKIHNPEIIKGPLLTLHTAAKFKLFIAVWVSFTYLNFLSIMKNR